MQDKVEASIEAIKQRIVDALGSHNTYVKLGDRHPAENQTNVRIEITLAAEYAPEGEKFAKHDVLIRNYLREVGIVGQSSRSILENEESGQREVVYKINLATKVRRFNAKGYLGAIADELTLSRGFAAGFAKETKALIEAIDKDFQVEAGWAYNGARVIEQGSGLKPTATYKIAQPQEPKNVVHISVIKSEAARLVAAEKYVKDFGKSSEGELFIAEEPEAAAAVGETAVFNPRIAREAIRKARNKTDLAAREDHIEISHDIASSGGRG